jgi:hypothetical protein
MKWNTQKQNKFVWHDWFAWYPIKIHTYGKNADRQTIQKYTYKWVWLEVVERREVCTSPDDYYYEYITK